MFNSMMNQMNSLAASQRVGMSFDPMLMSMQQQQTFMPMGGGFGFNPGMGSMMAQYPPEMAIPMSYGPFSSHLPLSSSSMQPALRTMTSEKGRPSSRGSKRTYSHGSSSSAVHKSKKRKELPSTAQESNATLRKKKHKEVEIRRRKKINDLYTELSRELEIGPTDKASLMLYALNFIRSMRKNYPNTDMKAMTGLNNGLQVGPGESEERGNETGEQNSSTAEEDESEVESRLHRSPLSSVLLAIKTEMVPQLKIQPDSANDMTPSVGSPVAMTRPNFSDNASILSIPPSPAGNLGGFDHL